MNHFILYSYQSYLVEGLKLWQIGKEPPEICVGQDADFGLFPCLLHVLAKRDIEQPENIHINPL